MLILEKIKLAQELIQQAKSIAEEQGILLYYKIHEFGDMELDLALEEDNWDSSSFCSSNDNSNYY